MLKKIIIAETLLLVGMLASMLTIGVYAYHIGVTWGVTIQPIDDYDNNELTIMEDTCDYISYWFDYGTFDWAGQNFFGPMTNGSMLYQTIDAVNDEEDYDILATFHVGHFYKYPSYSWIIIGYDPWGLPIFQQVGPTYHNCYLGNGDGETYQSGINTRIQDNVLNDYTGPKEKFTMIWTCTNGDKLWGPDYGLSGWIYGYEDSQNYTGLVGMPYAWTDHLDLSLDGYASPDQNHDFCYIGFENNSQWLGYTTDFYPYSYSIWVEWFYYYAIYGHNSIRASLDLASEGLPPYEDFSQTDLYNGYWGTDMQNPPQWTMKCYMRIYGDGDMVLPYN